MSQQKPQIVDSTGVSVFPGPGWFLGIAAARGHIWVPHLFVLHGRMSKKQRAALMAELDALAPEAPRILLVTGKLVGEGFDHPPLDTLLLAMPVSCKGTLQQYAGRLHREHASKTDVRIIDIVDTGHPALLRMWDRRQRGDRAMAYRKGIDASNGDGALAVLGEQLHAG